MRHAFAMKGASRMAGRKIEKILFDLPDRPMTKEERVRLIKQMIQEKNYITRERLDAAIDRLIEEIDQD